MKNEKAKNTEEDRECNCKDCKCKYINKPPQKFMKGLQKRKNESKIQTR